MNLYREKQTGRRDRLFLQSYMFGNSQMYQILNRLRNLQERWYNAVNSSMVHYNNKGSFLEQAV